MASSIGSNNQKITHALVKWTGKADYGRISVIEVTSIRNFDDFSEFDEDGNPIPNSTRSWATRS